MEDCLFCMIAEGKIPSKKLYEDDQVVAFYDINPQAKVHFLVVPKKHIQSAAALTEEDGALLGHIFAVIAKLAKEVGLDNGYRVISNVGEDAGQTVKHLHFHVLGGEKLPKMAELKEKRRQLAARKKALYTEYRSAQEEMRQAVAVKANIDHLLGVTDGQHKKEQER